MTDYVLRHINRTRIINIYRRKLIIWTTIVNEDIDNRVDTEELIADNSLFHGQALGYLTAISEYLADRETELLESELQTVLEDTKRRVNHYLTYYKYIPK